MAPVPDPDGRDRLADHRPATVMILMAMAMVLRPALSGRFCAR
jgi:hypothetical protein